VNFCDDSKTFPDLGLFSVVLSENKAQGGINEINNQRFLQSNRDKRVWWWGGGGEMSGVS